MWTVTRKADGYWLVHPDGEYELGTFTDAEKAFDEADKLNDYRAGG